ncbi:hypothetical protein ISF_01283 [Cordyceps fumosorosea ARSEF 2679]|uniref:Uncharacterized protein n=1 Tax=Cordyceps fumosorosea (strain ARSEF 2679) TaxID=1081104 RepID=A0A168D5Z1_CORFA|nr:hypothetical protein ISF_01283 [Cordyceps fumosorosea ARSEF 2679]OAA72210.1 hypothetical protein ISF_01283 [Cordyceps fumosorosea ARSEF 2679]
MSVQDCELLIQSRLMSEYTSSVDNIFIHATAELILGDQRVGLWAQSLETESVLVNMLMPGIKRFLARLATYGTGYPDDYKGVRYKFMPTNLNSGTTSPAGSL